MVTSPLKKEALHHKKIDQDHKTKIEYKEFESIVIKVLTRNPQGICWGNIRLISKLKLKRPPAIWVKKLEQNWELKRLIDNKTGKKSGDFQESLH